MRWLKYLLICLLSLVVFVGGALFSHFIGDIKELLHIGERSRHYTLDVADVVQIPYERYESWIVLNAPKASSSNVEELAGRFSRIFGEITDHIAKSPLYKSGACSVQSLPKRAEVDSSGLGSAPRAIECIITEQDIAEYKTLLKEIDYLALKSGGLRIEISSLQPIVDFAQVENAKQDLRKLLLDKAHMLKEIDYLALKSGGLRIEISSLQPIVDFAQVENAKQDLRKLLLDKAHKSAAFYAAQTTQHCLLLDSNERSAYSPNSVIKRVLDGGGLLDRDIFSGETSPISADITLPLEKSAPLYLKARITIRCD